VGAGENTKSEKIDDDPFMIILLEAEALMTVTKCGVNLSNQKKALDSKSRL
jgi:hypothetical protein